STELALRVLAQRMDMNVSAIRRDLEEEKTAAFEKTRTYSRVFAMADRMAGKSVPRATVPQIALSSPKITRNITSEWFAGRVQSRYEACLKRLGGNPAS